jgi:hypothetical protein
MELTDAVIIRRLALAKSLAPSVAQVVSHEKALQLLAQQARGGFSI